VDGGARLYLDLTTFAVQFTPPGATTSDPTEIIDRHLEAFAGVLATSYGADVYFRLYGGGSPSWKVREGRLEDGAHLKRTVHAGNSGRLPDSIHVAALDTGGAAKVAEALQVMKAVRNSFESPFRLLGYASAETPAQVQTLGEVLSEKECDSIPEVVSFFRAVLRPRGDYCLLIHARGYQPAEGEPERPGFLLLDLRLFEKSRSN
jgi:hypothetical protein